MLENVAVPLGTAVLVEGCLSASIYLSVQTHEAQRETFTFKLVNDLGQHQWGEGNVDGSSATRRDDLESNKFTLRMFMQCFSTGVCKVGK